MTIEENPLLSKPRELVEAFFASAEGDAIKIVNLLEKDLEIIKLASKVISPISFESKKDNFRIAAVDGSSTPFPAQHIGVSLAVISAGYMVMENGKIIASKYRAKSITSRDTTEKFSFAVKINRTLLEREMAIEALSLKPDLLIIDGSLTFPIPKWTKQYAQLQKELIFTARELAEKTTTIGIIKRGVSSAIVATLFIQGKLDWDSISLLRDKFIMECLLQEGQLWAYSFLSELHPRILSITLKKLRSKQKKPTREEFLGEYQRLANKEKLFLSLNLQRAFVKMFSAPPPFEVEYFPTVNLKKIMGRLKPWCNPATGLPFVLDLLDHDIMIEQALMRAYSEEVYARALNKTLEAEKLTALFKPLNPEKE